MKTRTIRVPVRVSSSELRQLDEKRGRLSRAAYLRSTALAATPVAIPEVNRDDFKRLGHALSSLNQAVHLANSGRIVTYPTTDFNQLINLLIEVRDSLIGGNNGSKLS